MKRKHILAFCAAILAVLLLCVGSFALGRENGIKHVVEDAEMWIMEFGDTSIPYPFDVRIWIDLDGETYEHFAFIG